MPEADRRAARLEAGLCAECGVVAHVEGRTRCEGCLARARQLAAERRELAARRGICEACMRRKVSAGRGRRCAPCADRYLARQLERERKARAAKRAQHDKA